ncbi:MAG: cob(I)yrinic acid a,c-diamide adenosyltransferase [Anaerolineae bacterium]|nr:cob(I)yrinic acid a,c-diamide adenosyltransferase [Anaerolineae bacterium]
MDGGREARLRGPGLVQIYTGDGKGKTTAALGLALRAAGHGYRTYIGQFMKGQDYGELHSVARLAPYVVIEQYGQPSFVHADQISAEDIACAQKGLARIQEVLDSGQYQLVVLDEICIALHFKLIAVEQVLDLLAHRPEGVELILTGRRAPQALLDAADLVTEMVQIKHPYERGVPARRGIET